MELTQTHLRYLLAIYDLAQTTPGVSAGDVSKVLAVSKTICHTDDGAAHGKGTAGSGAVWQGFFDRCPASWPPVIIREEWNGCGS